MHHFAYGSNMSLPLMRARCPTAVAVGTGRLLGWRYTVMREGYGSIVPSPGGVVLGVLWRIAPRDLAALNAYENVESGLYRRRHMTIEAQSRAWRALVYVGRSPAPGRPKPGYQEVVVDAARHWGFPDGYVEMLARWASGSRSAAGPDTGEIA